jgi:hypothetical protein
MKDLEKKKKTLQADLGLEARIISVSEGIDSVYGLYNTLNDIVTKGSSIDELEITVTRDEDLYLEGYRPETPDEVVKRAKRARERLERLEAEGQRL